MKIKKRKPILIMAKADKPKPIKVEEPKKAVKKVEHVETPKPKVTVDKDAPKTKQEKVETKVNQVQPESKVTVSVTSKSTKPEQKPEPKTEAKPEAKTEQKAEAKQEAPAVKTSTFKGLVKGSDAAIRKALNVEALSLIKFGASAGEIGACNHKIVVNPTLQVSKAGLTAYPDETLLDKEIYCASRAEADSLFNIMQLTDSALAIIEVDMKFGAMINKKFYTPRQLSKLSRKLGVGNDKIVSTFTSWF